VKYKAYPSYKDSGIEWLGDVPEGWERTRLKFLGFTYGGLSGKAGKDFNQENNSDNKAFIPFTNIANNHYIQQDNLGTVTVSPDESQNQVKKDDLFFLMSSEGYEDLGKSSLLKFSMEETYLNSFCKGFRIASKNINSTFLNYLLSGDTYRQLLYTQGNGFTRINLRLEKLQDLPLLISTSLHEQKSIANYLDKATAKIDTLIEKQTKLIALLKEKRQAVISSAVTRGLDASVPMKDSGVEWLGEIPEHWGLSKTGLLLKYLSYGFTNPMPTTSDGPIMLTANDIQYDHIEYQKARSTSRDAYETLLTSKSKPKKHDLLLTKDGTLGRVAIHEGGDVCINQSVALLRVNENKMSSLFLLKALLGSNYQNRMIYEAGGTTIKHIYISRLAKMALAVPPLIEQRVIVDYISKKQQQYNSLIKKSTQAVELLKEKRTALISAAVTGKIDVRDAA